MGYLELVLYLLVGALVLALLGQFPTSFTKDIKDGTAPPMVYARPLKTVLLAISLIFIFEVITWPVSGPWHLYKWIKHRRAS